MRDIEIYLIGFSLPSSHLAGSEIGTQGGGGELFVAHLLWDCFEIAHTTRTSPCRKQRPMKALLCT